MSTLGMDSQANTEPEDEFATQFEQDLGALLEKDQPMSQEEECGIPASQPRPDEEDAVMDSEQADQAAEQVLEEKFVAAPAQKLPEALVEKPAVTEAQKPAKALSDKPAEATLQEEPLVKPAGDVAGEPAQASSEKPPENQASADTSVAVKSEPAGSEDAATQVAKLQQAFPDLDPTALQQVHAALQRASTSELAGPAAEGPAPSEIRTPEPAGKKVKSPEEKAEHAAWMRMSRQLKSAVLAGLVCSRNVLAISYIYI